MCCAKLHEEWSTRQRAVYSRIYTREIKHLKFGLEIVGYCLHEMELLF